MHHARVPPVPTVRALTSSDNAILPPHQDAPVREPDARLVEQLSSTRAGVLSEQDLDLLSAIPFELAFFEDFDDFPELDIASTQTPSVPSPQEEETSPHRRPPVLAHLPSLDLMPSLIPIDQQSEDGPRPRRKARKTSSEDGVPCRMLPLPDDSDLFYPDQCIPVESQCLSSPGRKDQASPRLASTDRSRVRSVSSAFDEEEAQLVYSRPVSSRSVSLGAAMARPASQRSISSVLGS
jgi:hypothetical protein